MKLRIVKRFHVDKERNVAVFDGYDLQEKPFFFNHWNTVKSHMSEKEMEHDIVWLLEMTGKIKRTDKYDEEERK